MSKSKRSSQLKAIVPAGAIGLLGAASAMGQTYIGATAANNWNASGNILATSSENHGTRTVTNLVSGINLDTTGTLSHQPGLAPVNTGNATDWLSDGAGAGAPDPTGLPFSAWAEFTFDQSYTLGGILIWQDNQKPYPYSYQGMQDCTIQVSNDGTHWTTVFTGAVPQEADGGAPNYYEPVSLAVNTAGISAQFVVITAATTNWNYATNGDPTVGLDAVMFQTSPLSPPPPPPANPQWIGTSGDWNNPNNWSSNTVPNGVGLEADLFGGISTSETLYTNTAIALGTLNFNNANKYEVTGTGSLTMQTFTGNAQIIVQAGTQEINLPTIIASNTTLNVASGATLVMANPLTINSGETLTQTGTGTVTYQSIINVASAGSIAFGDSTHAQQLNLASGSTASVAGTGTVLELVNLSNSGTLDLQKNALVINYGSGADPITTVQAELTSGYAGGAWNGAGINSSAAAATSSNYALGYADSADPGNPAGLAAGTIEVLYTLLGDANLDGAVNGTDFALMASNFNKADAAGHSGWDEGDFNYDGSVNGSDFAELAANFNKGTTIAEASADMAVLDSFAAANGFLADVPEPASLGILTLTAVASFSRRRRRNGWK